MLEDLEMLLARTAILDCMARYAHGVDRKDWDAVRSAYHSDAFDEHSDYSGDVEGLIEWIDTRHASIPFSMHFLGQSLIKFVDDRTAAVETYFVVLHRRPAPDGSGDVDAASMGRYVDRFEKRDGEWKVATRRVVNDSSRVLASTYVPRTVGAVGSRDQSDPVFDLYRSLGL